MVLVALHEDGTTFEKRLVDLDDAAEHAVPRVRPGRKLIRSRRAGTRAPDRA
jgi:hypothetical protein